MITYNGKDYELKFNIERIKLVEGAFGMNKTPVPILTIFTEQGGACSLDQMEKIFRLCLKEVGSDYFCNNKQATEIFEACLQLENGYKTVNEEIVTSLMECCPFLFPRT